MAKDTAIELIKEAYDGQNGTLYGEDFEFAENLFKIQLENCWDAAHQAGRFEGKGIAEENWQTFEDYYKDNFEYDEKQNPPHCLIKGVCDDKICLKNFICNYDERH